MPVAEAIIRDGVWRVVAELNEQEGRFKYK